MKNRLISAAISALSITVFITCSGNKSKTFAGMEMVLIPGNANIQQLYFGKYEVTQKQYEEIMGKNPSQYKGKPDNPVEKIEWFDAVEFCNKLSEKAGLKPYYNIDKKGIDPENLNMKDPADDSQSEYTRWKVTINKDADGFRLPSSDEWEYACKAGTATKYYWGDTTDFSVINQYAVSNKDFDEKNKDKYYGTERVGSKKPNAWGLYDMSGNVSEWCFDWHPEYKGYHRIVHGGNWYPDETFALLMSGKADYSQPHIGKNTIGFRVVKKL